MAAPNLMRKDGTLPVENDVRRILRESMKRSGKDRALIAREMKEALGRDVSPSMLADFCRNGTKKRQVRFPAAWVPAFCAVVADESLQEFALSDKLKRLLRLGRRAESLEAACDVLRAELLAAAATRPGGCGGPAKRRNRK